MRKIRCSVGQSICASGTRFHFGVKYLCTWQPPSTAQSRAGYSQDIPGTNLRLAICTWRPPSTPQSRPRGKSPGYSCQGSCPCSPGWKKCKYNNTRKYECKSNSNIIATVNIYNSPSSCHCQENPGLEPGLGLAHLNRKLLSFCGSIWNYLTNTPMQIQKYKYKYEYKYKYKHNIFMSDQLCLRPTTPAQCSEFE